LLGAGLVIQAERTGFDVDVPDTLGRAERPQN
jgi:hypothetical protein